MHRTQDLERLIGQVSELGRQLTCGELDPDVSQFQEAAFLNVIGPQNWSAIFPRYSDEELCWLLMGVTFLEARFQWIGGSVCSGIWIFNELVSRSLSIDQLDSLTAWVVQHRYNEYNPFGTIVHGDSRTYSEFLRFRKAYETRSARRRIEIEAEERAARLARQQRREQREYSRRMTSAEREARLARLTGLSPLQQLELIISDEELPVNFYPGWVAGALSNERISALSPELREKLRSRLKGRFRGPWGALKKRLLRQNTQLDERL